MKGVLKRSLSLLLALAIIFPIFGNIATSLAGSGTETDPYTVAEAIANNTGTGYVEGYVVGFRTNNAVTTDIPASPSNIVISDTKGDTSINTTLPVQFSSTSGIRNNADITTVGNKVRLYGSLETYFTKPGLKNVKDGTLVEEAPVETSTETVQETPVETVVETVEENLPTTNANLSIYIAENGQWNDILKLHEQRLGDLRLNDDSKGAYTLNQNGQPLYTHNNINTDKSSITFADVKHGEYTVKLTLPEGYTLDERTFDCANISRSAEGNFNITVNGTTYSQNYSIFLSKDTSVTREKITFTFDANGGVFNDSSSEKVLEFEKNTKYTRPGNPAREGYRGLGWYSPEGKFINVFTLQNLTEDTVLTHRWQRQHTITFENNTASVDGVNTIKPIKVDEGKLYTLPNPYPSKTQNYEFMGWDLDGDGKVDKLVGEKIEITADTTLYYV